MRIAVNARFLLPGKLEGLGWYTHELLRRMAALHPQDEFLLFFDRPYDPAFRYADNVRPVVLSPKTRHPAAWWWWFEIAVPAALRRHRADVFFSPDCYLSLRAKTPTVMTVHDLIPLLEPGQVRWWARAYFRFFIPRFLRRAEHLVTVSDFVKKQVVEHSGIPMGKVTTVYNGCREGFQPLPETEQRAVRETWAAGQPYFFYTGAIHPRKNIPRLIRAFDQFKTQTGAPVKLLLAGRFAWQTGPVRAAYEQAVFKNDIHFLGYVPEDQLTRLMASALALVNVSVHEGFGLPVLEALYAETPVICSNVTSLPEVAGDAALLVDPFSETDIARALEKMYGDVSLRADLIEKGRRQRTDFDWDQAARKLHAILCESLHGRRQ